jgi:hypothetical protein
MIRDYGYRAWSRIVGYGRRWMAETAISRFKALFGEHLPLQEAEMDGLRADDQGAHIQHAIERRNNLGNWAPAGEGKIEPQELGHKAKKSTNLSASSFLGPLTTAITSATTTVLTPGMMKNASIGTPCLYSSYIFAAARIPTAASPVAMALTASASLLYTTPILPSLANSSTASSPGLIFFSLPPFHR